MHYFDVFMLGMFIGFYIGINLTVIVFGVADVYKKRQGRGII